MEAFLAVSLLAIAYLTWLAVWPALFSYSTAARVPVGVVVRGRQATLGDRGGRRSGKTLSPLR
jgi:hypothetical protein